MCYSNANNNGVWSKPKGIEMRSLNKNRQGTVCAVCHLVSWTAVGTIFTLARVEVVFQCIGVKFSVEALQSVYNFLATAFGRKPKILSNNAKEARELLGYSNPSSFSYDQKYCSFRAIFSNFYQNGLELLCGI